MIENKEKIRLNILHFLQWRNPKGSYIDQKRTLLGMNQMEYEEAVQHFFGLINYKFYSNFVNDILDLTYEETINTAVSNNFYIKTIEKMDMLLYEIDPTDEFYWGLLEN